MELENLVVQVSPPFKERFVCPMCGEPLIAETYVTIGDESRLTLRQTCKCDLSTVEILFKEESPMEKYLRLIFNLNRGGSWPLEENLIVTFSDIEGLSHTVTVIKHQTLKATLLSCFDETWFLKQADCPNPDPRLYSVEFEIVPDQQVQNPSDMADVGKIFGPISLILRIRYIWRGPGEDPLAIKAILYRKSFLGEKPK